MPWEGNGWVVCEQALARRVLSVAGKAEKELAESELAVGKWVGS